MEKGKHESPKRLLDVYRCVDMCPQARYPPNRVTPARRIQCDGHLPTCRKCVRAQRKCEGYNMRLSWPKDSDKKRAIVADSPPAFLNSGRRNNFFVNTTSQDMQVYRDITLRVQPYPLIRSIPKLWMQSQPFQKYTDLIQHCKSIKRRYV